MCDIRRLFFFAVLLFGCAGQTRDGIIQTAPVLDATYAGDWLTAADCTRRAIQATPMGKTTILETFPRRDGIELITKVDPSVAVAVTDFSDAGSGSYRVTVRTYKPITGGDPTGDVLRTAIASCTG